MVHSTDPTDELFFPENRNQGVDVTRVNVSCHAVVVAENVTVLDTWVVFPVVFDHVLDRSTHGSHVDDDSRGGQDGVTRCVIQRETQLTFLFHDGGCRDFL